MLNGNFSPGPAFIDDRRLDDRGLPRPRLPGPCLHRAVRPLHPVLAILCWANGQFASYAVFGHHRPLNAVIMSGIALVLNMSLTLDEQLGILIWFSLAAMFLLIRLHALDERSTWLRHRLGDAGSLSSFYLRGGTAFIVAAVLGALVLTSTAASAPLSSLWRGADQHLVALTQDLDAIFRGGGRAPDHYRSPSCRRPGSRQLDHLDNAGTADQCPDDGDLPLGRASPTTTSMARPGASPTPQRDRRVATGAPLTAELARRSGRSCSTARPPRSRSPSSAATRA